MIQRIQTAVWLVIGKINRMFFRPIRNYDEALMQIKDAWLFPPPDFDEQQYLHLNMDVRQFVKEGRFASGFDHYMKHGIHEGRDRPYKH